MGLTALVFTGPVTWNLPGGRTATSAVTLPVPAPVGVSGVAPPAPHPTVGQEGARVEAAPAHRHGPRHSDHRHGRGVGRLRRAADNAVAELAVIVFPPAAQGGVVEYRALVKGPGFDGPGGVDASRPELHGLPDSDRGISRGDGDPLRRNLGAGQAQDETENSNHGHEVCRFRHS